MTGLIPLGDPNAIACEGDSCAVPVPVDAAAPAGSAAAIASSDAAQAAPAVTA